MKHHTTFISTTSKDLLDLFSKIDSILHASHKKLHITTLGGASIILQGFRERATRDIDIANNKDATSFQDICNQLGVPVDIITIASTVDFDQASKVPIFNGQSLLIDSVTASDLIKLKLERFRKQDPEDIYAIIEKIKLPYQRFKLLVKDMIPDFVGNPRELQLSATIVVERIYPNQREDFLTSIVPLTTSTTHAP